MLYHEIDVSENSICPKGEFRHCPNTFFAIAYTFLPCPTFRSQESEISAWILPTHSYAAALASP